MSCSYSLHGTLVLHRSDEVQVILDELIELLDDDSMQVQRHPAGQLTVAFFAGTYMSYSLAEDIADHLSSLGPFAVTTGRLIEELDGAEEVIFVGSAEAIEQAHRQELLRKAEIALQQLDPEDQFHLLLKVTGLTKE